VTGHNTPVLKFTMYIPGQRVHWVSLSADWMELHDRPSTAEDQRPYETVSTIKYNMLTQKCI